MAPAGPKSAFGQLIVQQTPGGSGMVDGSRASLGERLHDVYSPAYSTPTASATRKCGPDPKIETADIYARALGILDRDGPSALTARRLAGELAILTKTLYKRISCREHLIDELGNLWAAKVAVTVHRKGFGSAQCIRPVSTRTMITNEAFGRFVQEFPTIAANLQNPPPVENETDRTRRRHEYDPAPGI